MQHVGVSGGWRPSRRWEQVGRRSEREQLHLLKLHAHWRVPLQPQMAHCLWTLKCFWPYHQQPRQHLIKRHTPNHQLISHLVHVKLSKFIYKKNMTAPVCIQDILLVFFLNANIMVYIYKSRTQQVLNIAFQWSHAWKTSLTI